MNHLYTEAGVKKKDDMMSIVKRTLMIMVIIVGVFTMLFGGLFSILGVAAVAFMVFLFPRLNVEYEYVFVDGQIDFDRITGKAKRKTMLRVDMEQVEIVAPEGSHALDGYTYVQSEKKDFTSGDKTKKPFIIVAQVEDKKYKIAFEPTEKMLAMMKQKSPRKIAQY